MSSLCFETLFFSTQFIQVIICCRGVCRGVEIVRVRKWVASCASCGGVSSAMGKFSILPYFFLRLFRGFWGIRELRRRGRRGEACRTSSLLPTNAFRSIPPLTLFCDSPRDPPPPLVPILPFTRHKFNGTFRIINKANRSTFLLRYTTKIVLLGYFCLISFI